MIIVRSWIQNEKVSLDVPLSSKLVMLLLHFLPIVHLGLVVLRYFFESLILVLKLLE